MLVVDFAAFQNTTQIADGIKPADCVITGVDAGFASHCRHVIDSNRHIQTAVMIELHQLGHGQTAVVVEGFAEAGFASDGVAEMNEKDFVFELGNDLEEVLAHHRIAGLAEGDAEVRTVCNLSYGLADIFIGNHDAGNVAEAR